MIKIFNKLFYILKNILLPLVLVASIYIVIFMFRRLGKEIFGSDILEFLGLIAPFVILLLIYIANWILEQKSIKENFFYNITSFLAMLTIGVFCLRTFLDKNMILWHKYGYSINFNYYSDQVPAIKVILYVLIFSNILLMIAEKLDNEKVIEVQSKENKKIKKVNKD